MFVREHIWPVCCVCLCVIYPRILRHSPFAIETLDSFGPSARILVKCIARRARDCGLHRSRTSVFRALLAVVLEGNAACILDYYSGSQARFTLKAPDAENINTVFPKFDDRRRVGYK